MKSLAREGRALYGRLVDRAVMPLLKGRPEPLVIESRNFEEYQVGSKRIEEQNSRWLRETWFRKSASKRGRLRGYCVACGHWTSFHVDASRCSSWEGRQVPWWANTLACPSCSLTARLRAALELFEGRIRPGTGDEIYITEQVTPLYRLLQGRYPRLVGSEYLADSTPKGQANASGVRSEDLTALSFPDARFDHLLHFEVLEHIPDYRAALRECARVLRPGGRCFGTVPFHGEEKHLVRARFREDGTLEHLLPAEYHGDPINEAGVLCYRYFGVELLDDLRASGFADAWIWNYWSAEMGYPGTDRAVFVAVR